MAKDDNIPISSPEWAVFLEGILDAMSAPISVVSANGQFIFINQSYADLFGIEKSELVGKPYTVHLKKDEISVHREVQASAKIVHGIKSKMGKKGLLVMAEGAPVIINGELKASVAVISDFNKVNRIMEYLKPSRELSPKMALARQNILLPISLPRIHK